MILENVHYLSFPNYVSVRTCWWSVWLLNIWSISGIPNFESCRVVEVFISRLEWKLYPQFQSTMKDNDEKQTKTTRCFKKDIQSIFYILINYHCLCGKFRIVPCYNYNLWDMSIDTKFGFILFDILWNVKLLYHESNSF